MAFFARFLICSVASATVVCGRKTAKGGCINRPIRPLGVRLVPHPLLSVFRGSRRQNRLPPLRIEAFKYVERCNWIEQFQYSNPNASVATLTVPNEANVA
jgi:hypothetical protein